jgi:hypothetical protein
MMLQIQARLMELANSLKLVALSNIADFEEECNFKGQIVGIGSKLSNVSD